MITETYNKVHERLGKHLLADGFDMVMDLEKSHDCYIVDENGDEYLDMFSMFASASIGYNHPYLVERSDWLGKMAVNKPSMSDVYNKDFADFLDTFSRVAIPKELQYAFFISGGALAVENCLKVAFDWKTRLNMSQGIDKEASQVIHFKQAFHGRTGYTMSLTNTKDPRKYMYFPKFDWPRIINPKMFFPFEGGNVDKTLELEKQAKEQIEKAIQENPNDIASICIETIQGEGGDNFFRPEFLQYLRDVCDENEILLIFDEVQTGMGITGKMWAWQHYGVVPDVMAFGKKTQVCGLLANKDKIDQVENNVFVESSRINSTFGGNFIDMMRFKLILEVIEKDNLVENAKTVGAYLLEQLQQLEKDYPQLSNARGEGLWCAFDFPSDEERTEFWKACYNEKLLLLQCGLQSIRFRPHLIVSKQHIDDAIQTMRKVLDSKS
ncbi:L-lysine 6-transaminase [Flavobacteriaceae bacterium Ap0902]|nr:L-lysine 6-transaminase [Flavobacteriaceae bacterium Ap0902]